MKKFLAQLYIKLIIFFSIAFVVCVLLRILFGFYVDRVPVFGSLLTFLTWISVAFGVLMVLFIVLIVVKAFQKNRDD